MVWLATYWLLTGAVIPTVTSWLALMVHKITPLTVTMWSGGNVTEAVLTTTRFIGITFSFRNTSISYADGSCRAVRINAALRL